MNLLASSIRKSQDTIVAFDTSNKLFVFADDIIAILTLCQVYWSHTAYSLYPGYTITWNKSFASFLSYYITQKIRIHNLDTINACVYSFLEIYQNVEYFMSKCINSISISITWWLKLLIKPWGKIKMIITLSQMYILSGVPMLIPTGHFILLENVYGWQIEVATWT